jgi:hypothetical protein
MQENQSETIIHIRIDLSGEEARRFNQLRKKRGLSYNSELFRALVKEAEDRELGRIKEA